VPITSSALGHQFTVSSVDKSFDTDTIINITKRREQILYRTSVDPDAANIAFVGSKEVSSSSNLSIADRSTSIAANRDIDITATTITGTKTFTINNENFVVTDIFVPETNTTSPLPLFYKHTLNTTNLPRVSPSTDDLSLDTGVTLVEVEILDGLLQPLRVSEKSIDLTTGIIYNNLLSEFADSSDFTLYYVKYTVNDNGVISTFVDLLDNEPVYRVATFDDLTATLSIIEDGRKVYLIEESTDEFSITLPVVGTYAYLPLVTSRLQILPPVPAGVQDTWFVRVTNGKFFTSLSGTLLKYHIAEFLNQVFTPETPIKLSSSEESTILSSTLIKLDHENINEDDDLDLRISIEINDADDNGIAAFTTDSDLIGTEADNGETFVGWNLTNRTGIKSIDHRIGVLDIEGLVLKSTYQVTSTYYYNEDHFEFTLVNFNPISNREALTTRLTLFIDPDTVLTKFDNTSGLDTSGRTLYYERLPDFLTSGIADVGEPNYVDPSGLAFFVNSETTEGTEGGTFLILGDVTVAEGFDVRGLTEIDARRRGGGVIDTSFDDAVAAQPEAAWFWDEGYWDGIPYPGNASYLVEIPVEALEGAGGTFTQAEVKDVVSRHTAAGVYPVTRAYGVEVLLTGIDPGADELTVRWSSK
jgi:hypothetical protein